MRNCFALALLALVTNTTMAEEKIVVGGGCFWCVEALYQSQTGIVSVVSGYAGGKNPNPTYDDVCSGRTGHAEVVEITYDPEKIGLEKIINLFWDAHDPTTLNRQGADSGTQYRSIIVARNDDEKALAEKSKAAAQSRFKDPIVTEIITGAEFFRAEGYHQDFYEKNPAHPYNRAVVTPKLEKFKKASGT